MRSGGSDFGFGGLTDKLLDVVNTKEVLTDLHNIFIIVFRGAAVSDRDYLAGSRKILASCRHTSDDITDTDRSVPDPFGGPVADAFVRLYIHAIHSQIL